VAHCLNAPQELEETDQAEVIYYGVVTPENQYDEDDEKGTAKDGHYNPDKIKVARGYLGTRKFPAFTNDTLSESEREYQRQHLQRAKEELARQRAAQLAAAQQPQQPAAQPVQTAPQPLPAPSVVQETKAEAVLVASVKETKEGVARRQKKPARIDNVVKIAEPVAVTPEEPVAYPMPETVQEEQAVVAEEPLPENNEYNPYYESGVAVNAPVTYDQISQN